MAKKKKTQTAAIAAAAPAPAATATASPLTPSKFALSELIELSRSGDSKWADQLSARAGINIFQEILEPRGGNKLFENDDTCYLEGCTMIVELLAKGRVIFDTPEVKAQGAELEVLSEIQSAAKGLAEANHQLDEKLEAVTQQVAVLTQQIESVKQAPASALEAQETRQEAARSVLIAGLVSEEVAETDLLARATQFVRTEVRPAVEVEVVAVSRMGRYSDQVQGSRRLKVEFATPQQAQAVLRAALHLKAFNQRKKQEGSKTVGLDPFLIKEELEIKRKLKGLFDSERAKGTPKVFWRGCRLYADGKELKL